MNSAACKVRSVEVPKKDNSVFFVLQRTTWGCIYLYSASNYCGDKDHTNSGLEKEANARTGSTVRLLHPYKIRCCPIITTQYMCTKCMVAIYIYVTLFALFLPVLAVNLKHISLSLSAQSQGADFLSSDSSL